MATNRRDVPLAIPAGKAWAALRDFGQVHTKVAPGFLTALKMDQGDRIVTCFNGLVARERLVTLDDESMLTAMGVWLEFMAWRNDLLRKAPELGKSSGETTGSGSDDSSPAGTDSPSMIPA